MKKTATTQTDKYEMANKKKGIKAVGKKEIKVMREIVVWGDNVFWCRVFCTGMKESVNEKVMGGSYT